MNLQHVQAWPVTRPFNRLTKSSTQHLGQLLHFLSDAFELRIVEKCRERGHRKFRNSHSAVISQLDLNGICLGELADRIGISQQATGKLVRDLERAGYVDSHVDARDKRSRIILLTDTGEQLTHDLAAILQEVREELVEILGDNGMQNLEHQLRNAANAFCSKAAPAKICTQ